MNFNRDTLQRNHEFIIIIFRFLMVSVITMYNLITRLTRATFLRADVCKYRPGVGKIKISKNPKKIQWTTLGTLFMKI